MKKVILNGCYGGYSWSIKGVDEYDGVEDLKLIPRLSEERIRNCKSVDEIVCLLRKTNVIK